MNRKTSAIQVFLFLLTLVMLTSVTSAEEPASPRDLLKQYIAELQKNPNDNALREKIIKLAQELKPAPAVPEEASRHIARGLAAFKDAKEAKDFNDAIEEFKKALLYAPWLGDAYYNLGVAQDKAGEHASAIKSLKLYLLSAPNAPDTKEVKVLIYEIEYRQEKAAKESSPGAIAAKEKEWLKKIDGARYRRNDEVAKGVNIESGFDIRGNKVICKMRVGDKRWDEFGCSKENPEVVIEGREFILYKVYCDETDRVMRCVKLGIISEDGNTIRVIVRDPSTGENPWERIFIYRRIR